MYVVRDELITCVMKSFRVYDFVADRGGCFSRKGDSLSMSAPIILTYVRGCGIYQICGEIHGWRSGEKQK